MKQIVPGSLRDRNIRREEVPRRGQFFVLLRRIVGLRNEKERKNGPLWRFRSRILSIAQAPCAYSNPFHLPADF